MRLWKRIFRFPPPPSTPNHPFFCLFKIIAHQFGMSQPGRSNDNTPRLPASTAQLNATSTSSWITTALITQPLEEHVNTPAVSSLAYGVVRVQWQFAMSPTSVGNHYTSFNVNCLPYKSFKPMADYQLMLQRTLSNRRFHNVVHLRCHWAEEPGAVPNCIPSTVFLENGDRNVLAVPQTSQDHCGEWSLAYPDFKQHSSLVLHLHFPIAGLPFCGLLTAMYFAQNNCDVTFIFRHGQTFKAHSTVLLHYLSNIPFTLRCDDSTNANADPPPRVPGVTRNLLLATVQHINDAPYHLFREMIQYSYVGILSPTFCTADGLPSLVELCQVAQRYGHRRLIEHCSARIATQIVPQNVLKFYTWAVDTDMTNLLEAVIKFMARNGAEVLALPQTLAFARNDPETYHQMMRAVFECQSRERLAVP